MPTRPKVRLRLFEAPRMSETPSTTTRDHNDAPSSGVSRTQGVSRTKVVWGALAASMTLVGGLLMLSDTAPGAAKALPEAVELAEPAGGLDALFQTTAPIDRERWTGIVIHHSGDPSGSADAIDSQHRDQGLQGLGYHFVIGNGRGSSDGAIHAGYRWDAQLPGAHAIGPEADAHNRHSIAICLVGDGNQKAFTDAQLASLIALVERLQDTCDIPEDHVLLHTDVAPTASPGRLFPARAFRAMLRTRG
ncbi:MAG: hypothetical protein Tsb0013_24160 [Phycisphaerales bacterium]